MAKQEGVPIKSDKKEQLGLNFERETSEEMKAAAEILRKKREKIDEESEDGKVGGSYYN